MDSPLDVFYDLALADVAMAADRFRPRDEATGGRDGFVSFELEPRLAHDATGSVEAASALSPSSGTKPWPRRTWPGWSAGSPPAGPSPGSLRWRHSSSPALTPSSTPASPAARRCGAGSPSPTPRPRTDGSSPASPERLARAGARPQHLLWASTGTKNPAYSDVVYVEELVGPDTVNTMPEATLDAFRHHGVVRPQAILDGIDEAAATLAALPDLGVDLAHVAGGLLDDGLAAFEADLVALLGTIEHKLADPIRPQLKVSPVPSLR